MPKHQEMVKHNMALLVPGASFENVTFNVAGTEVASRGIPATTESWDPCLIGAVFIVHLKNSHVNMQNGGLIDDVLYCQQEY